MFAPAEATSVVKALYQGSSLSAQPMRAHTLASGVCTGTPEPSDSDADSASAHPPSTEWVLCTAPAPLPSLLHTMGSFMGVL